MPFLPDLAFIKTLPRTEPLKSIWDDPEQMTEQEAFEMGLSGFNEHMRRISEGSVPPESMSGQPSPSPALTAMEQEADQSESEREAILHQVIADAASSPDGIRELTDTEANRLTPSRQMPPPHGDGDRDENGDKVPGRTHL